MNPRFAGGSNERALIPAPCVARKRESGLERPQEVNRVETSPNRVSQKCTASNNAEEFQVNNFCERQFGLGELVQRIAYPRQLSVFDRTFDPGFERRSLNWPPRFCAWLLLA
jgi:hypothetical protein